MAILVRAGTKNLALVLLGRYVPMAGKQFGRIVSFSLTIHTWELDVTSEVEIKMILLGHQISYVIYYQLKGHLTIIFNVLFGFSISQQTDVAFFLYEYLRT
jgi:hypothetical protein